MKLLRNEALTYFDALIMIIDKIDYFDQPLHFPITLINK